MWKIKIFLVSVWLEEKEEKKIDEIRYFQPKPTKIISSQNVGRALREKGSRK